jgi:hypothetical protein
MRTRSLITVCIILLSTLGCKNSSAQEKFSEAKVKEMLKNFYTSYIIENSTFPVNQKKRDSIEHRYCTKNVFNQFEGDIDYDIFLKSQMVDTLILKTMTFRKDPAKDNEYHVSYTYNKDHATIKLLIVKEKHGYKIDLVYKD